MSALAGRTIALAVTGSIAAYKAVEVARLCIKAGAKVLPLMTTSAQRFVGAVTLAGITGEAVATEMWDPAFPGEMHVSIAGRADLIVIVPGTADLLARLAQGRADDLVTATVLCARGPALVAPAMHPRMWTHPATQRNVEELARQGRVTLIGPVDGPVASGGERDRADGGAQRDRRGDRGGDFGERFGHAYAYGHGHAYGPERAEDRRHRGAPRTRRSIPYDFWGIDRAERWGLRLPLARSLAEPS